MDQSAEGAVVHSETRRLIEFPQTSAAGGAYAVPIERICVDERRSAGSAEEFSVERGRGIQALIANGDTRPFEERAFTDAAIVRKENRKNAVGDPVDGLPEEVGNSRSRYRTTREGAPPDMVPASRRF
jgi:hypothetical protein